jgi:hypothetical protein
LAAVNSVPAVGFDREPGKTFAQFKALRQLDVAAFQNQPSFPFIRIVCGSRFYSTSLGTREGFRDVIVQRTEHDLFPRQLFPDGACWRPVAG